MIHINEELCIYCGACVAVCPENIIDLVDTHLKIDQEVHGLYEVRQGLPDRCPLYGTERKDLCFRLSRQRALLIKESI